VLDEPFCHKWDAHRTSQRRDAHRKRGGATDRIVRYADDLMIMVAGTKVHADALWDEVAEVIAPLGLRLSAEKSRVCHLDEGFDSFMWHRVTQWLLKRHKQITWAELYRRFLTGRPGNRPAAEGITMFDAAAVPITRYRWRANNIPTPWISGVETSVPAWQRQSVERRMR
jgi:hypothetical protein